MFGELKKDFSSVKLLITLATIAISIYLLQYVLELIQHFSDIILILFFGWLVSFILDPFVDFFTNKLKIPRVLSTVLVFVLCAVLIVLAFLLFIPDVIAQFRTLEKTLPSLIGNFPPPARSAVENFIGSIGNIGAYIPSLTQFIVNLVTVLILSFYLILDRENLHKKLMAFTPRKYHDEIQFVQKVINQSFASFVRVQVLWGVIGGILTWAVLTIFGVSFAASTSIIAGILTAVPVIGPIIGVIPPLLVSLIEKPDQAVWIFLIIFGIQQLIFNAAGPKIIGKAFNINPVIVILSLLIGIKIAGATGAVFAIPVVSILLIVGRELYERYFKERES